MVALEPSLSRDGGVGVLAVARKTPTLPAGHAFYLDFCMALFFCFFFFLMLSVPLPYIANTAGWMTAELGRQPWLIYGLMRTAHGISPKVGAGNAWFTLIGFMGLYTVLAILWLFLVYREIELGPDPGANLDTETAVADRRRLRRRRTHGNRLVLAHRHHAYRLCAARWLRSRRRCYPSSRRKNG